MWLQFLGFWHSIRSSYWFAPTVMAVCATILALAMVRVDEAVDSDRIRGLPWIYTNQPEGARALLTTVAGSMITVAGVVFSITVVALSLASSQFGSRLIENFMRDAGNQIVLGTFVSTFIYCLLVLRAVQGNGATDSFVPHLSVLLAVVLTGLSVGVFIYFIHHVAESIQAPRIVANISDQLEAKIESDHAEHHLFPETIGRGGKRTTPEIPKSFDERAEEVAAVGSGYLQVVNEDKLLELAVAHDVILSLTTRPGGFVYDGAPLLHVFLRKGGCGAPADALRKQFSLGDKRVPTQDVELLFDRLVEVAVRALSPGINDPYTALQCVDRLGQSILRLASREQPSRFRLDDEGNLRVIVPSLDWPGLIDRSFGSVRRHGAGNLLVAVHLLRTLGQLSRLASDPVVRNMLLHEAAILKRQACQASLPGDCLKVEEAYEQAFSQPSSTS